MQNYDKALHFGVGIALAAVAGLLGLVWSIPAVAAVAVGKEVYDLNHRDKHTPDWMDAITTVVGAIAYVVLRLAA